MDKKVNGWENQETYQVKLLLDNDLNFFLEDFKKDSKHWIELSDKFKEFFKDLEADSLENGTLSSIRIIIGIGSLYRVNFDEIARSYFE